MASGETHTREVLYPRGHARSPMSEADVEAKFHDQAGRCLSHEKRTALLAAIANLEQSGNVGRDLVPLVTQ
jgi:2-methylcitrate dehydratase PrpD